MVFGGINYIAVLVAAVAAFAFGAVYYMTLAKPWIAAVGKTEADMEAERRYALTGDRVAVVDVVTDGVPRGGTVSVPTARRCG